MTDGQPAPGTRQVFTIGHSNHSQQVFIGLVRQHQIDVVADVRSQPYTGYATHFNAGQIQPMLAEVGIQYVFLGEELGGRPTDPACYDADGYVLYDRVAASTCFLQGIERLETGIQRYCVAVMCSEENPAECHRNLLIGRVLAGRGIILRHIRADGRLQSQAELDHETAKGDDRQQVLFEELKEVPWRSIRSVLPKPPPPDSLEH
jgi:uncharacterized protein (DUF488 family)